MLHVHGEPHRDLRHRRDGPDRATVASSSRRPRFEWYHGRAADLHWSRSGGTTSMLAVRPGGPGQPGRLGGHPDWDHGELPGASARHRDAAAAPTSRDYRRRRGVQWDPNRERPRAEKPPSGARDDRAGYAG